MDVDEALNGALKNNNQEYTELDYFRLLFSDEIIELLVEESNNYYKRMLTENFGLEYKRVILTKMTAGSLPYLYITKGISKEDILAYIGIRIYMGLHKLPSIKHYWKKGEYQTNIYQVMPRNYFLLLGQALHFPEKEKENEDEKEKKEKDTDKEIDSTFDSDCSSDNNKIKIDPRHKINLYLEKLAKNFQKYYVLGNNVTIDESLLLFKGRNSMKFYIPMKPHKWGFKIHLLCDSDTHYLYNMLFDPGKSGKDFIYLDDTCSVSESIVLRLLSCINDRKQRNVFCDGWYSSISLMKKLTKMGYLITTVLRNTSKEIPSKLKLKGYDKAYDDEILIQKYEGKKTILFATNYNIDKEKLRNIYNIKNRGVDTFDHYLEISSIQRRTLKWYKKILLFGIDASIINSKIICELKTGKSYTTVEFKEKIFDQIFKIYKSYNNTKKNVKNNISSNNDIKSRLRIHNINFVKNSGRKCEMCHRETAYFCVECNVGLHPECFNNYHQRNLSNRK